MRPLAIALLVTLPGTLSADRADFTRQWQGRTVTLAQPLYTVYYTSHRAFGGPKQEQRGVVVVTPDRGMFYGGHFNYAGKFFDRDVHQLVTKVSGATATGSRIAATGAEMTVEADKGGAARLVTFPSGSRMRVKAVDIEDRAVVLKLYDEFTTRGPESTSVTVEWSGPLSRGLTEADAITRLLATVLSQN